MLADDRDNLAVFAPNMQEWIAQLTIDALKESRARKFAVVTPQEFISDLATNQAVEEARRMVEGIEIEVFQEMGEAEQWLVD